MYVGKYKDCLFDGRWVVDSTADNGKYLLRNIYNGDTTIVSVEQITDILNGKTSVSKIRCRRMGHHHSYDIRNSVTIGWGRIKYKWAKATAK